MAAGCASTHAADTEPATLLQGRVTAEGIEISGPAGAVLEHPVDGDVEAFDIEGNRLFWVTDDDELTLHIGHLQGGELRSQQLALPMETEVLCAGQIDTDSFDLFLADGDGKLLHTWLTLNPQPALREVRRLSINPDGGVCDVSADRLYVLNGPAGIVSFLRSPENDPIMTAEYLWAPAGGGTSVAETFRLAGPGDDLDSLLIWDDQGQITRVVLDEVRQGEALSQDAARYVLGQPHFPDSSAAQVVVTAAGETEPVVSSGDAADDPAILSDGQGLVWILGTDKRYGLNAYDLEGALVESLPRGRLNNVDAVRLANGRFLVAASNRTYITLDLFIADLSEASLKFESAFPLEMEDPYGLCMAQMRDGVRVFVGDTDGNVEEWRVNTQLRASFVRRLVFDSQTEGCVVDGESQRLFVGEEATGIWSVDLATGDRSLFASVSEDGLAADVEGLDICRDEKRSWLIASSQGDDSFFGFDLSGESQPVRFRVGPDLAAGIDGVSETDGLACTREAMPGYPEGILVLQDGRNRAPEDTQNFKLVDWRSLPTPTN